MKQAKMAVKYPPRPFRMRENMDQKYSKYGHFSHSVYEKVTGVAVFLRFYLF